MKSKIMFGMMLGVIFMFFLQPVMAQEPPLPPLPCSFYGNIIINDEDAPIGTIIVAKVDNEELGSITTVEIGEYGGPNALDPKLVVNEPTSGDLIIFYINNEEADQTATWVSGGVINLDLSANISTGTGGGTGGGGGSSGGGGGSSGGGGGSTQSSECTTQWSCTLWKPCEDGMQVRTCSDFNNCEKDEGKPLEERECTKEEFEEETFEEGFIEMETEEEKPTGLAAITGAVVGALGGSVTGILIILVIIFGGLGGYFALKGKRK